MRTFTAVVERDPQTKLFVGYVPGFSGAHSQGATLQELRENLREVISMLLEDGEPKLEAEFVGAARVNNIVMQMDDARPFRFTGAVMSRLFC